jgi:hypothetical protein
MTMTEQNQMPIAEDQKRFLKKMAEHGIVTLRDLWDFFNLPKLDQSKSSRDIADMLLALMLSHAIRFYDERAEAALCIAMLVVTRDIGDETAKGIIREMSSLAYFMLFHDEEYKDYLDSKDVLSADTRERLEKIQAAVQGLEGGA